jgi:hypothetical protein
MKTLAALIALVASGAAIAEETFVTSLPDGPANCIVVLDRDYRTFVNVIVRCPDHPDLIVYSGPHVGPTQVAPRSNGAGAY